MPVLFVSTQIRLEQGPTTVGDEWSDPELMEYLGAKLFKQLGNNFLEYRCDEPPRVVLNKLERVGYRILAMTGVGQTCIWTLHKEIDPKDTVQLPTAANSASGDSQSPNGSTS